MFEFRAYVPQGVLYISSKQNAAVKGAQGEKKKRGNDISPLGETTEPKSEEKLFVMLAETKNKTFSTIDGKPICGGMDINGTFKTNSPEVVEVLKQLNPESATILTTDVFPQNVFPVGIE